MFATSLCRLGTFFATSARWNSLIRSHRGLRCSATTLSVEVKMPSLSPTMSEGQIVKWEKQEGEKVNAGDVICDIQTDKAVVSLESDEDGVMAKIIQAEGGGTIKVGELIAILAEDGEDWKDVANQSGDKVSCSSSSISLDPPNSDIQQASGGSTPGTALKMPALSPTMTEGTIVNWCKKEGEKIEAGDVICEIQTDKAVVAIEADDDSILAKILIPEGETGVQIGSMIALTVEEGEDWQDVQIPTAERAHPPSTDSSQAQSSVQADKIPAMPTVHLEPVPNVGPATNLLIAQYGIDPSNVKSTGPKGIIKEDIMLHIKAQNLKPIELTAPEAPIGVQMEQVKVSNEVRREKPKQEAPMKGPSYTDIPLTTMRSVIAKRLVQSKQNSPHGYATAECNINALHKIRNDFLMAGIKISLNDLIIKAVATTLQYIPEANLNVINSSDGDDIQIMPNVDISVAVATNEGLITPIVKNVPSLSLAEISSIVKDLATRARNGQLKLDEFQGGTFTISNLGMFGINEFTAIINPPQCAILAVGKGTSELIPHMNGRATHTLMKSTLSFDRRFVDENLASDFMATLQKVIEHPEYMNIGPVPLVRQSIAVAGL